MRRIPNGTVLTYRTSNRYGHVWKVQVVALIQVEKGADYYIVIATHQNNHLLTNPHYKYPRAATLERQNDRHLKTFEKGPGDLPHLYWESLPTGVRVGRDKDGVARITLKESHVR